ncbi:EpsG family protein [Vibrio owensii]|uniref:EpsG family protein n=1 Tax=Vibrio owensii TaxID=696485 RepID=UPI003908FC78
MIYLSIFFISLSLLFTIEKSDRDARAFLYFVVILVLCFTPAFQFKIGTDYTTYYNISNDIEYIKYLAQKREYVFYLIYHFIYIYDLDGQAFFIITALLQSALLVNILRLTRNEGYSTLWLFVGFFLITNIYHNQMNHIRTYVAVLFFTNALLYRYKNNYFLFSIYLFFSIFSHATTIFVLPLLMFKQKHFRYICRHAVLFYFLSIFVYSIDVYRPVLEFLVKNVVPFYSGYLDSLFNERASFFDLATKFYYLPLSLYVLSHIRRFNSTFSTLDNVIYGLFLITCNSFIMMSHSSVFLRLWSFLVIFYALVLARVFSSKSLGYIKGFFIFLYLLLPYFLKVTFLASNEYLYDLYFFH